MFTQGAGAKPDHLLFAVNDLRMLALHRSNDHEVDRVRSYIYGCKFHKVALILDICDACGPILTVYIAALLLFLLKQGSSDFGAVVQPAAFVCILAAAAEYLKRLEPRLQRSSISGLDGQRYVGKMEGCDRLTRLDALGGERRNGVGSASQPDYVRIDRSHGPFIHG